MKTPDKSREIDRAAEACLLALSGDAAGTFIRNGFLRHSKTHPYMQELFNLYVDRKIYGPNSASFEAFYRAFDAWVAAEIERHALDAAGVSV